MGRMNDRTDDRIMKEIRNKRKKKPLMFGHIGNNYPKPDPPELSAFSSTSDSSIVKFQSSWRTISGSYLIHFKK